MISVIEKLVTLNTTKVEAPFDVSKCHYIITVNTKMFPLKKILLIKSLKDPQKIIVQASEHDHMKINEPYPFKRFKLNFREKNGLNYPPIKELCSINFFQVDHNYEMISP